MSENDLDSSDKRTDPATLVREVEAVLGRRVDDLERDNRRLSRRSSILTLAVAAALTMAAGSLIYALTPEMRVANVVNAHQFVMHDSDGNVRGSLGPTAEGGSRLVLKDRAGHERLRMTLLADGSPGLSFADSEGRSRVVLGFLPDQTANLVFADRFGRTRAVFGLMPDESSTLVFADGNGETRVGLGIDTRGGAGLTVFERAGEGGEGSTPAAAPADSVDAPIESPPSSG
ncbi:MAG TPA: hypothetical protein VK912_02865 [Longimicrobiales bacterium]|nr:hypothetical protein [Longimicrobiales bacterium]